ncbi:SusD/RagB family nutrient-binding outer membrane lipoprotein [Urechidicola vernalis]|uniref:SusD/RagB family nutrient-binding outer membrane lipoprotein n=1 Tax=Urechidicola vernalis TaxID=3075600 RepID=A0ABU2Y6A5_9FLAO|nr:SusD/RagB family nutrient-binding outer membrane lipoprotein [Urechidicola sp. P050]MDT0552583.1 SusD/RagB family nutrient-binding outer membrane lipoprotein [Urechidicola sp. P050]
MNKIFKNIALFVGGSLIISSCDTVDFGNTNNNPNEPTAAVTSQLLTGAQRTVGTMSTDLTGMFYTQQLTDGQYPGESRYATLTESYNGYFTGPIQSLNEIIKLNTDEETKGTAGQFGDNDNQIAVAMIIRAHILHFMTDQWGGLPWDEAFQGIDNPQPKFNTQQELYDYMFDDINVALNKINSGAGPAGDVIFDGDMARWTTFANSLKMTMALRISHVNPALAKTHFEAAVGSGSLIMDNSENIEFSYGVDPQDRSQWYNRFETREDFIMAATTVEALRAKMDYRLLKYGIDARDSIAANPTFPNMEDAGKVGAPHGEVNGNVPDYSFPPAVFIYELDTPTMIYSAAQTQFALAEAAMNGWNTGGVTQDAGYANGISASMNYWGVGATERDAYIAANPLTGINDIAYEKWVALYLQGQEAWSEWRRLDYPVLVPSSNAADERIPVRHAYDESVENNNKANYDEIVSKQGQDDNHTKLWWDVN